MIDTKELRRLAQAATPGYWYVERGNYVYGSKEVTDGEEAWHPIIACTDDDEASINFEGNAKFIAAANPAAISELLDRLDRVEKTNRDWLRANSPGGWIDDLRMERNDLRAAVRHEADCIEAAMAEINSLRARIETAENDAAHQKALAESALRVAEGWERKCGELRARIEQMEKQKPVASVWRCDNNHIHGSCEQTLPMGAKLYALPGAQPAPIIPEGWKLVPIKPTPSMKTAGIGVEVYQDSPPAADCLTWEEVEAIYTAMIEVAPEVKP